MIKVVTCCCAIIPIIPIRSGHHGGGGVQIFLKVCLGWERERRIEKLRTRTRVIGNPNACPG